MNEKEYFEFVSKNIIRDLEYLIEINCKQAGIILNEIFRAIDTLGGCLYGFKKNNKDNSKKRSVKFMQQKLHFDKELAFFLYLSVRCGNLHEGSPKNNVKYFHNINCENITAKYNNIIHINTLKFTKKIIEIVKSIKEEEIKFKPNTEIDISKINNFNIGCFENFEEYVSLSPDLEEMKIKNEKINMD